MAFSSISAFKQKFVEVFDKDAKTQDNPEFVERIGFVNKNETKIKAYTLTMQDWIDSTSDMLQSNIEMANAMYVLNQNSEFEPQVRQVMYELGKTKEHIERI